MERKELAVELHHRKYNCAQSVACAFADKVDMDERDVFRAAESFGFGMGYMKTCGALSGVALIIGLMNSDGNLDDPETKKICYAKMKQLAMAFEEKNGSTVCMELKGVKTGKVLRSCDGCVEDAAELLEKLLESEGR